MNVEEAIQKHSSMSDRSAIVAIPPLTWGSEAMIVDLTDSYHVPPNVLNDGYVYLLGKVDLEELAKFLDSKEMSTKSQAEFVIHYALYDCAPEWVNDIPNKKP